MVSLPKVLGFPHSCAPGITVRCMQIWSRATHPLVLKLCISGSSHCGSVVKNTTSIQEDVGLIPCFAQWDKDLVWPWLWHRLAAIMPIRPLEWELLYGTGATPKKKKKPAFCTSKSEVTPPHPTPGISSLSSSPIPTHRCTDRLRHKHLFLANSSSSTTSQL